MPAGALGQGESISASVRENDGVKSWLLLVVIALTALVVLTVRRSFRGTVVTWMAPRLGPDAHSGRRMALLWHVGAFLLALDRKSVV